MPALVLAALSLGLSNFAAAIGIGVAGADARTRVRVGVVFGIFEAGMPVLGLALGHGLASTLGRAARWAGCRPADRHRRVRAPPGPAGRRRRGSWPARGSAAGHGCWPAWSWAGEWGTARGHAVNCLGALVLIGVGIAIGTGVI